jgi:hypothetical protein
MQNAFSPSPRVSRVLTVPTLSKKLSKVSTETQHNLLVMSPWKSKTQFTHFQNTMAQRTCSYSQREEWGTERRIGAKAKLKPNRTKVKSCSSLPGIWGTWWTPKGLGSPYGLALCSPPGLALLTAVSWCSTIPGIFNCMGLPLQLKLHPHSFTHCFFRSCLKESDPATHCLVSQDFIWRGIGHLYGPLTLALHMPAKPHGWHQGLPVAQAIAAPPWTMAATAFKCLSRWT